MLLGISPWKCMKMGMEMASGAPQEVSQWQEGAGRSQQAQEVCEGTLFPLASLCFEAVSRINGCAQQLREQKWPWAA